MGVRSRFKDEPGQQDISSEDSERVTGRRRDSETFPSIRQASHRRIVIEQYRDDEEIGRWLAHWSWITTVSHPSLRTSVGAIRSESRRSNKSHDST